MTELGRTISNRLNADALVEELAAHLQEKARGKQPYEIQEMSFEFASNEYDPPDDVEALIKACAYDNGLKRQQVLDVLAIVWRDKLLAMA